MTASLDAHHGVLRSCARPSPVALRTPASPRADAGRGEEPLSRRASRAGLSPRGRGARRGLTSNC